MTASGTLSLAAPFSASLPTLHPILGFYFKYATAFKDLDHAASTSLYSKSAVLTFPDGKTLQGSDRIWSFYRQIYGPFYTNDADCLSLHIVSDESTGTHTLHIEMIRHLCSSGEQTAMVVPQYFVYTIRKVEGGAGAAGAD